ncbi:hypothetical protein M8818_003123 [Zalaria obscura]|uniref:Uncharacterized protein n=1 Tax=Zalaria obscura TaxID=2024903 RepID=A0ACC3SFR0_9PEZI
MSVLCPSRSAVERFHHFSITTINQQAAGSIYSPVSLLFSTIPFLSPSLTSIQSRPSSSPPRPPQNRPSNLRHLKHIPIRQTLPRRPDIASPLCHERCFIAQQVPVRYRGAVDVEVYLRLCYPVKEIGVGSADGD